MSAMLVVSLVSLIIACILAIGEWASGDDRRPSESRIGLRVLIALMLLMSAALVGRVLYEVYPEVEMPRPAIPAEKPQ